KSAQIREILISESAWEEMTCLFAPSIEDFIKPGNLDSLIYVCDDEEEQFLTVKAIMSMTGAKVSSDGHIKLRLRRIHDRYKQQFNGKKIRKNQKSSLYKHR
ncbi:hypothetical protein LOS16_24015, partial [Klebsiella pneumoniae]|nr:hypothetical protein [Klebsiella pneumoniae]MCY0484369.1 hypothetical protein [Klebsiella pneumoniae]